MVLPEEVDCINEGVGNYMAIMNALPQNYNGHLIHTECLTDKRMIDRIIDVWKDHINPCDPNGSFTAVQAALSSMNGCSVEAFDAALPPYTSIYIDRKKLKAACPLYYCIIKQMMENGLGSEFVCNLSIVDLSSNISLAFVLGEASDFMEEPTALALTTYSPSQHVINIKLNSNFCNGSPILEMMETIQHELMHADILNRLILKGWNGDPDKFSTQFEELVGIINGVPANESQHYDLLYKYLEPMVNSLLLMNGNLGTFDDYVGCVLYGFPKEILISCGFDINDVKNKYLLFKTIAPGIHLINLLNNCQ